MESFTTLVCQTADDFSRAFQFMLRTKNAADPFFRTANAYAMVLRVLRYGTMLRFENEEGRIIGIVCYTFGSALNDYEDRNTAYVEYCLAEPSKHGTTFFLRGLTIMVNGILEQNPQTEQFMLAAQESHSHNNRLYSKFATKVETLPGDQEASNVYSVKRDGLMRYLAKFG